MNLVEFLFALGAVSGMTGVHILWARFVYKLENSDQVDKKYKDLRENNVT